ncbi:MAG: protein translocase subunit SecF [Pseudomonadaceae bacterium]|nr:protein translocase subunit SecF [Pseudomonadaceae bacterium]
MTFPLKPFENLPFVDFMAWRRFWVWSSVAMVLATFVLLAVHGLNFGIDFVGGKLVQVQTAQPTSVATVRAAVQEAGFGSATIQEYGAANEYLVRLPGNDPKTAPDSAEKNVVAALAGKAGGAEVRRVEFVGPQVGQELRTTGLVAVLLSFAAILVYITLRFEFRYGLGAIASLFHDTVLTVGVMSLLSTEVTLTVLAAIMTLIGYSLNDTIVVFDRIRETRARYPNKQLTEVLNLSVNQTLGRTIMTAGTTLIVLAALFFVGGEVIHDFALVLIVGIILGTYSSVFVASPVLLALEEYYQRMVREDAARAAGKE